MVDWRGSSLSPNGPDPNRFSITEYAEFTADREACESIHRGGPISTAQDKHRLDMRAAETAPFRRSAATDSHGKASASPHRLDRQEGMPNREASNDHRHSLDYDRSKSQRRDERRQPYTQQPHSSIDSTTL